MYRSASPYQRQRPAAVPREIAERLVAERDALLREQRRLTVEVEQTREALRRSERDVVPLRQELRQAHEAVRRYREASGPQRELVAEVERLRAELDRARVEAQRLSEALAEREADVRALHDALADAPDEPSSREQELLADLETVRRNQAAATERAVRQARADLLLPLADAVDDLLRATAQASEPSVAAGLRAVVASVERRLAEAGAERFAEVGDRFDPAVHEAIGVAPGAAPDTVVDVARSGVRLEDGVVLRPAQVVVSVA